MCDVLVAMNPASLKANLKWAKPGATLIVDSATFDEKGIEKAGYQTNPLEDGRLDSYNLIKAPISLLTQESLKALNLDKRTAARTKNIFALGLLYFQFNRYLEVTLHFM